MQCLTFFVFTLLSKFHDQLLEICSCLYVMSDSNWYSNLDVNFWARVLKMDPQYSCLGCLNGSYGPDFLSNLVNLNRCFTKLCLTNKQEWITHWKLYAVEYSYGNQSYRRCNINYCCKWQEWCTLHTVSLSQKSSFLVSLRNSLGVWLYASEGIMWWVSEW